jgi:hypothetical protein
VELALLILLILNSILIGITIVIGLLVGSIVVQVMEVLRKLPEELRNPKKREVTDQPWWKYT